MPCFNILRVSIHAEAGKVVDERPGVFIARNKRRIQTKVQSLLNMVKIATATPKIDLSKLGCCACHHKFVRRRVHLSSDHTSTSELIPVLYLG